MNTNKNIISYNCYKDDTVNGYNATTPKKEFESIYFEGCPEMQKKLAYYALLEKVRQNKIWPWTLQNLCDTLYYCYEQHKNQKEKHSQELHELNRKIDNSEYRVFKTTFLDKSHQDIFVVSRKEKENRKTEFITLKELKEVFFPEEIQDKKNDQNSEILLKECKKLASAKFEFVNLDQFTNFKIFVKENNDSMQKRNFRLSKLEDEANDIKRAFKGIKDDKENRLTNWDHLIVDGSDNLPLSLLNFIFNENYSYYKPWDLQKRILKKKNCISQEYILIKEILDKAFRHTEKLINYDSLIAPIYYSKKKECNYIAPLYLTHNEKPDCVVVLKKDCNSGNDNETKFCAVTLLNMDEARKDVNVLGILDRYISWLL